MKTKITILLAGLCLSASLQAADQYQLQKYVEGIGDSIEEPVFWPGEIARYSFDNNIVNAVNGNPATGIGINFAAGIEDAAVTLSGNNVDRVVLPNSDLHGLTDFTFSGWINLDDTSKEVNTLLSVANSTNYNHIIFGTYEGDLLVYFQGHNHLSTAIPVNNGEWAHFVLRRAGGDVSAYVNGTLRYTTSGYAAPINAQYISMGQEQDSVGGSFVSSQSLDGEIDEVRIFNRAVSASEINDLYNRTP